MSLSSWPLALCLLSLACVGRADDPTAAAREGLRRDLEAHLAGLPEAPDAVQVALAFDADFDLDLYVTDPREEAVYFANERSESGGRLLGDHHCGRPGAGLRVEQVVFEQPLAGRYRVGVDHMRTCRGGRRPAPFAVAFRHAGRTLWATGELEPLVFDPVVLEVPVGPATR